MVHILHAGPSDAHAMARIHKQSFAHPWDENALRHLMDKREVLALAAFEPPHEMSGFIITRLAADEGEILTIAIAPSHRRKGVGVELMAHALELSYLRGAARIFLEVAENNKAAIALYRHFGFEETGRRKAYYPQGQLRKRKQPEDALIMSLDLEAA